MATTTTNNRCAETVYRGTWARRGQCERKAGFGKDEAYCKQHSAAHLDGKPVATWYKTANSDYRCSIESVEVLEVHESHLVIKTSHGGSTRTSKKDKYETYFPSRTDAVVFCRGKVAALRKRADEMEASINSSDK